MTKRSHYHTHEGEGHRHPHPDGHHGPAFGKKRVIEVPEEIVWDINKCSWCCIGKHGRCHGPCNCRCPEEEPEPSLVLLLKQSIDRVKELKQSIEEEVKEQRRDHAN